EQFFARVLEYYGYETSVGSKLKGKVIIQEVDIVAVKGKKWMIECKYHNQNGTITKLHPALYTYARFLDLKGHDFDAPWLVTNTKCSGDAIRYASGVNLKITSWKFPREESLEKLIEKKNLYPITILNSASDGVFNNLYDSGLIVARDLLDIPVDELSRRTRLDKKIALKLIEEAGTVCK
ncbi:MAG: restriction endonuclease, partial [Nanoarchaeota archaeon]|nr:restriction endonuclease [Nanoarchaeota archaeon]